MQPYLTVAVVGATGLVGQKMVRLLEERRVPVRDLRLLGSRRAESRSVEFHGERIPVVPAEPQSFAGADLVLASAGGSVSRELLPGAAREGAICIDNTSAFRLHDDVPLVVPEVNGHRLDGLRLGQGGAIVANPNCSTIQLVAALKPLHDAAGVERVVVSTYQSISGAGRRALERFDAAVRARLEGGGDAPDGIPALDVLPVIGDLDEEGSSTEETKMRLETPKILEAQIEVDVTCVRVPVVVGHAESVLVGLAKPLTVAAARSILAAAPDVVVADEDQQPTPRAIAGRNTVHVGRIRRARCLPNALQMWVVADNLLKGAAFNAVQIAERVIAQSASPATAAGPSRV